MTEDRAWVLLKSGRRLDLLNRKRPTLTR